MEKQSKIISSLKKPWNLEEVRKLTSHISISLFGKDLYITTDMDKIFKNKKGEGRIYIQIMYNAPCTKTGKIEIWKGGKHYLSPFMTESEIIFRAYKAFKDAVEHEINEGFKFDNIILINPHINFRKLLEVSPYETSRQQINFDF